MVTIAGNILGIFVKMQVLIIYIMTKQCVDIME